MTERIIARVQMGASSDFELQVDRVTIGSFSTQRWDTGWVANSEKAVDPADLALVKEWALKTVADLNSGVFELGGAPVTVDDLPR